MKHRVVAIDGPAASGKSSVARALARRLGFSYVNSGGMYRAITWDMLEKFGSALPDDATIRQALAKSGLRFFLRDRQLVIELSGESMEPVLRETAVNREVSNVSARVPVREFLLGILRDFSTQDDLVMEGRDIGSMVFPETPYKFYLDASPEIRRRRRADQGFNDSIRQRDQLDSSRQAAPLIIADDAFVVDSTNLTVDGVVGEIIGRLKLKGLSPQGEE